MKLILKALHRTINLICKELELIKVDNVCLIRLKVSVIVKLLATE